MINEIRSLFDSIMEPKLKWSINDLNLLKEVKIENDILKIKLNLVEKDEEKIKKFEKEVLEHLKTFFEGEIDLDIGHVGVAKDGIENVENIILIASGKGGVGKSTVSVNIAAALVKKGKRVGLLDSDVYGPSIPKMLGFDGHPEVLDNEYLMPMDCYDIKFISAASLIPPGKAMEWRGQLVSGMIIQFINKTFWGELDFLIIDLPPGTGDIHLTIANRLKVNGAILVTTPQEVVWGDVARSIDLIRKHLV